MSSKKISQLTEKNSVIATDIVTILDSADSFGNKKTTMGAIKALVIPSTADITGDTLITVGNGTNVALGSTSVTLTLDNDLSKYDNTTSGFATTTELSTGLATKENAKTTITDLVSTTITLANANANTDYQYGTLTALEITANDTSYLETNIWFTAGEGLNSVTITETLIPMNDFAPIEGNKCCICIMNDTVLFGTEA